MKFIRKSREQAGLIKEQIKILPFYHDLRNRIVRPRDVLVESHYFFRKWKPRLGPVLTLLIMELRDRCYWNRKTGEKRDYCWPSQEEWQGPWAFLWTPSREP